jgi:hypothetical protein
LVIRVNATGWRCYAPTVRPKSAGIMPEPSDFQLVATFQIENVAGFV